MDRRVSLKEFLAALDTVRDYVVRLESLFSPSSDGRPVGPSGDQPASRRKIPRPVGTWPKAALAVLQSEGRPMKKVDVAQKIADVQNVPVSSISHAIAMALYELKRKHVIVHDKNAGTYSLKLPTAHSPVVARPHADT